MDRRNALKALAGLGLCAACARAGFAADHAIWNYEGASGPEHWGDLDAADKVCSTGSQQSPINVEDSIAAQLSPLKFSWAKQTDAIVNNGHTIQLNFEDGGALKVGRASYKLVQFHFHHPSEHHVDDKDFPMEIHFVHRNNAGGLGVVGVLVKPGKSNPTFAKIIANMPDAEGPAVKAAAGLNPSRLLPRERGYYRYSGSLTTPPCSETVEWMLLKRPIEVAAADIAAFAKIYPMNARPTQKIDRRFVLRSV